ncbi:MAG: enoyl-CoA hydratase [Burkholderiaceae bacterium]
MIPADNPTSTAPRASASEADPVLVRIDRHASGIRVATVTINNARRLNSLNSPLMQALVDAVDGLRAEAGALEDPVRALVLTGAGEKAFVGGADIDEMAALDAARARAFITRVHRCCDAVRAFPAPVIARIQGYTLGAGLELAAACDLRVAVDTAVLGMPEVKLGIPSVVEAALLPGLVGWGRTREMLLLGENFGAAEALAWGLVERVVPFAGLDAQVDRWLGALAGTTPGAVRIQKHLISRWETLPMDAAIQAGIDAFEAAWAGDEPSRAMAGFLEARRAHRGKAV